MREHYWSMDFRSNSIFLVGGFTQSRFHFITFPVLVPTTRRDSSSLMSKAVGVSEYLNTLTSFPSSMLTILIFPSSVLKQIYFFWNCMRVLIGDTFSIFLMRLDRWWFQIATWPFFNATTNRKSLKKVIADIPSLCWPSYDVRLTLLELITS